MGYLLSLFIALIMVISLPTSRILNFKVVLTKIPKPNLKYIFSWGAEEFSLCGSREFVEEFQVIKGNHKRT